MMAPMGTDRAAPEFVGRSATMREVLQQIELVRDSAVSVLVTGERGTGRERVARMIHQTGCRQHEPFVHVDCPEVPADVMEEILFGGKEPGRFEVARGGTLFLDGVDALSLPMQEKLLRVLEKGTVQRLGDGKIAPVRARLVASTVSSLRPQVEQGTFRRDLFCRLNVFPIALPPLRHRREDIASLAQLFLERHKHERTPPVHAIEERALSALKSYGWPGNVRELELVVLGAVLACGAERVVRLGDLPPAIRSGAPEGAIVEPVTLSPVRIDDNTIVPLDELERRAIQHALKVTGGNVTRAARALGIGRATMYRKLERFKMNA